MRIIKITGDELRYLKGVARDILDEQDVVRVVRVMDDDGTFKVKVGPSGPWSMPLGDIESMSGGLST